MIMNGETENMMKDYGKLVAWSENPDAFEWTTQQKQCIPGEGLLILEIQERLLTFLVQCCTQLLHDIPEPTLTSDSFPVLPELPLEREGEISGFESLGVMAAEAPYRAPAQLDLALVESLLATKASAVEDHVWSLREDPEYFFRTLQEAKDHRQETLKDLDGNTHPLMNRDRGKSGSQAKKLVSLQKQYADEISPSRGLPEEYLHALLRFRYYLRLWVTEPLSNLRYGVLASPPLRKYFARLPPDAQSTNISVVLKCGHKMGKVEKRVIWLLRTLSENGPCLSSVGMPLIVDELERLLQSDPRARDLLSSYVTTVVGDISIISQCLHQLETYYPWARGFAIELSQREANFEQDCVEWTKPWAQVVESLRRRTKESVAALRNAEAHLDAFWADIDRVMIGFSDKSSRTAVWSLLSQQRILKRTTEWIEPIKPSTAGTADIKGKGAIDTYFAYDPTSRVSSNLLTKSLDVTEPRRKVKTRGISQPPVAIAEAETLTRPDTAGREPTLFVDERALKVFQTIFFNPTLTSTPGEVPWNDLLHAMTSVGFTAMKLYGSAWQFQPTRPNFKRGIQFHEPHPRRKLPFRVARLYGRMLNRAYGWDGYMFALAGK
ncbi:hypothetical protein N7516_002704 [Penicillium verrucosum]|uniref:uncharacterized protein n=1 Tax=Penicillium verrucosum TaxID=60171 RepID=UPI002545BAED|nr:uncharacterized protein N7516_002704 [Penicillium verrucosum]KAJ5942536.1 hypothetical protein N7516_002704 [Penicillium verrucosum]